MKRNADKRLNSIDPLNRYLIGVIDLQSNLAVRATGGNRDQYQATQFFRSSDKAPIEIDGDYLKLIRCYRSVGIKTLYAADLDALQHHPCQRTAIETIVLAMDGNGELLLDLGICQQRWESDGDWIGKITRHHPNVTLIIATESAENAAVLRKVIECIGHQQVAVSFDYKSACWCSTTSTEQQWFTACQREQVATVIGLDLAAVGGESIGATVALCKKIRQRLPQVRYITGGGIRSTSDAMRLIEAGADELLVASLFTSHSGSENNDSTLTMA